MATQVGEIGPELGLAVRIISVITSSISMLCCFMIIGSFIANKRARTEFNVLIFCLAATDGLSSLGFLLASALAIDQIVEPCKYYGPIQNFFLFSQILWNICIGTELFSRVCVSQMSASCKWCPSVLLQQVLHSRSSRKSAAGGARGGGQFSRRTVVRIVIYCAVCWLVPLFSNMFIVIHDGFNTFGLATIACWISNKHIMYRWLFLYGWAVFAFFYNMILYVCIVVTVQATSRRISNRMPTIANSERQARLKVSWKLSFYLLAFLVEWVSSIINLFTNYRHPWLFVPQAFFLPAQGTLTFMTYWFSTLTKEDKIVQLVMRCFSCCRRSSDSDESKRNTVKGFMEQLMTSEVSDAELAHSMILEEGNAVAAAVAVAVADEAQQQHDSGGQQQRS